MPYLLILLICFAQFSFAQSSLNPGDIAIVHYNADGQDEFSFVCLRNIDSGTQIYFTDNGWYSTGAFRATEGVFSWNADTIYNCGDVIHLDSISPIALSSSGDQLFAYQGSSSSPSFITAFNNEGAAVWQSTASNANSSALPSVLSNGVNALAIAEVDNVKYVDSLSGSLSALKTRLFTDSSFAGSNTVRQSTITSFNVSGGCVLPVSWLSIRAKSLDNYLLVEWQTAQEINSELFQVQHSLDARNFKTLRNIAAAGNSNSILSYQYHDYEHIRGYYRIKQIDFDGQYSFSPIVHVSSESSQIQLINYGKMCEIHGRDRLKLRIYNMNLELLDEKEAVDSLQYQFSSLPSALYILHVQDSKEIRTFKVFVAE